MPVPPPFLPYPPGYPLAQYPITMVTHLHGGEDRSDSDGHPEAWFTANGLRGDKFITDEYIYPNNQNPTTLWYHDHSLGITRLNIQLGLLGMYIIRDPQNPLDNECTTPLPHGKYEIPLVLQDHTFNADGSLFFPNVGDNPDIHPYWEPEFFGTVNTVNGKAWPNLDVERRQYRFRIVNGNNARFMNLFLSNGMPFTLIGTDGGYLAKPLELTSVLMGIAERVDILIDFSKLNPGTKIILRNDAPAPFPGGDEPFNPATNGVVMQFTVGKGRSVPPKPLPAVLNTITPLTPDTPPIILTLFEVEDPATDNPVIVTLDGQRWHNDPTETPRVGSTQDWVLINLTDDAHPIHLHLIEFQVINRQQIDRQAYTAAWLAVNGQPPFEFRPTIKVDPTPFLIGPPVEPPPEEQGWKDTIKVYPDSFPIGVSPGAITRIRVRIAPQDADPAVTKPGVNPYPFDATFGPGYVWHCHILDHEDQEMMRPFVMIK
jgi:FtsP/CotA-like multicopper oxidase with cupredoxin domain